MNREKPKKLYIELMRIFAIFFVIYNHTWENGFTLYQSLPPDGIRYWVYCFAAVFCKFSVPLFLTISGALLLAREESILYIYRTRLLRIVLSLILFTFIYYLKWIIRNPEPFSLREFLKILYSTGLPNAYHLWYLYAYIAFLMSLPLLRAFIWGMKRQHFLYLFACATFFSGILPTVEYLLWNTDLMNYHARMAWTTTIIILFPCLGYYLEHVLDIENMRWTSLASLWLISILTILFSCFMVSYEAKVRGEYYQTFHEPFNLIKTATLYITIKYICAKHTFSPCAAKAICSLGSATFGIYLTHLLFLGVAIRALLIPLKSFFHLHMVSLFVLCMLVFLFCYAVTLVLKRIPLIGKLL